NHIFAFHLHVYFRSFSPIPLIPWVSLGSFEEDSFDSSSSSSSCQLLQFKLILELFFARLFVMFGIQLKFSVFGFSASNGNGSGSVRPDAKHSFKKSPCLNSFDFLVVYLIA
ncbi:hypothetical protein TYRP_016291, partial [Tyrophagus putrescentiae]